LTSHPSGFASIQLHIHPTSYSRPSSFMFTSIQLHICPASHLSDFASIQLHVHPASHSCPVSHLSQITSIPDHVHPRSYLSQTTSISDHIHPAPCLALHPSSVTSVQHIQHQHICIATSHLVSHNTSTQHLFSISTSSTMASVFCPCQMCL